MTIWSAGGMVRGLSRFVLLICPICAPNWLSGSGQDKETRREICKMGKFAIGPWKECARRVARSFGLPSLQKGLMSNKKAIEAWKYSREGRKTRTRKEVQLTKSGMPREGCNNIGLKISIREQSKRARKKSRKYSHLTRLVMVHPNWQKWSNVQRHGWRMHESVKKSITFQFFLYRGHFCVVKRQTTIQLETVCRRGNRKHDDGSEIGSATAKFLS